MRTALGQEASGARHLSVWVLGKVGSLIGCVVTRLALPIQPGMQATVCCLNSCH